MMNCFNPETAERQKQRRLEIHRGLEGPECPVCYELLSNPLKEAFFPCGHGICVQCYARLTRCPVCRCDDFFRSQAEQEQQREPPPPPPIRVVHVNERGLPIDPINIQPEDFFAANFESEFVQEHVGSGLRVRVVTDTNVTPEILNCLLALTRRSASGTLNARLNGFSFRGTAESTEAPAPSDDAMEQDSEESPINFSITLV